MSGGVSELNLQALELMSGYLMRNPRFITARDVEEVAACGVAREEAVVLLLCAACGLDERRPLDRRMIADYVRPSLARLEPEPLLLNPYMRRIRYFAPADYTEGSPIEGLVRAIIDKTAAYEVLEEAHARDSAEAFSEDAQ